MNFIVRAAGRKLTPDYPIFDTHLTRWLFMILLSNLDVRLLLCDKSNFAILVAPSTAGQKLLE